MRAVLILLAGVVIGAGLVWFVGTQQGRTSARTAGQQIGDATRSARDTVQDELRRLHLGPGDVKDELARSGQVVRRTAQQAGHAIADATADARITAAIKTKLIADRDLSALSISVNTTEGRVTLSGTVASTADIGRAMVLALETEGVREVISTLQVKPRA
jgi:hyperosmotically inducible periplasmic protein